MSAGRKIIFVLGLGIIAAAIILELNKKNPSPLVALPSNDDDDNNSYGSQIVSAVRRVWESIPASPYLALLRSAGQSFGLPDTLLERIAWIESRFSPTAKSPAGAVGIMQIVPSAHPGVDAANPNAAIPYAASYLRQLYNQFGTWEKAIAAYNWGPGNLQKDIAKNGSNWKAGLPLETSNYLLQVNQVIDLPA